jgi:glucosamine kinase
VDNNLTFYAGIDGGGSKCSAILFNHKGEVVAQGIAGAANAARDLPLTLHSIVSSIELALKHAKLDLESIAQVHVGAGLAGACVPNVKAQLLGWKHPFASFKFASDLTTACYGAHAGNDGAVLIVGTGSSAARMQKGQLCQFGGHGFVLGDKGSGAWFGRKAVTATLESLDGLSAFGPLNKHIVTTLAVTNTTDLLQSMISASPSQFAVLAPGVIALAKQGDHCALALVEEGVAYLDKLCQRTLQDTDLSIVLMGGLAPSLEPWFSSVLRARIVKAQAGPEWGAMQLLQSHLPLAC